MRQMVVNFGDVLFHPGDEFVRLVRVEFQDTSHFDFHQFENILFGHFTDKLRIIGCQTFVDMCAGCVHIFGLLEFFVLIDTFFDKYLLERREVQCFQYFTFLDFQFLFQQVHRVVCRLFQDFTDSEEVRFAIVDNTAVGRDAHFAIGESIEGVYRFVR